MKILRLFGLAYVIAVATCHHVQAKPASTYSFLATYLGNYPQPEVKIAEAYRNGIQAGVRSFWKRYKLMGPLDSIDTFFKGQGSLSASVSGIAIMMYEPPLKSLKSPFKVISEPEKYDGAVAAIANRFISILPSFAFTVEGWTQDKLSIDEVLARLNQYYTIFYNETELEKAVLPQSHTCDSVLNNWNARLQNALRNAKLESMVEMLRRDTRLEPGQMGILVIRGSLSSFGESATRSLPILKHTNTNRTFSIFHIGLKEETGKTTAVEVTVDHYDTAATTEAGRIPILGSMLEQTSRKAGFNIHGDLGMVLIRFR